MLKEIPTLKPLASYLFCWTKVSILLYLFVRDICEILVFGRMGDSYGDLLVPSMLEWSVNDGFHHGFFFGGALIFCQIFAVRSSDFGFIFSSISRFWRKIEYQPILYFFLQNGGCSLVIQIWSMGKGNGQSSEFIFWIRNAESVLRFGLEGNNDWRIRNYLKLRWDIEICNWSLYE